MKSILLMAIAALAVQLKAQPMHSEGTHSFTNHLIHEKSPYLLQHAHNPVDWYPWGEEAFAAAKARDKPIFLSIGYATCHWCHVMEHESFENEAIAALMNEAFICIKVDREERPDIDNIYMTVCQMMTGQGGWPLTIIMTPDKKPFHATTYMPPDQRFGRMGMKQFIPRISQAWEQQRDKIMESSHQISEVLAQQQGSGGGALPESGLLARGYDELMSQYDARNGGFGERPKFPTPHRLVFLTRQGEAEGVAAVEHTLDQMRKGGIFDQVGFGFHRYSTDTVWLVPHFEKMLYDQALLAFAYTEAYALTGKPLYRQVVEEILEYVLRDMTSEGGGFYSAEDADSEGEEGVFYLWSTDELKSVLGGEFDFVAKTWNAREEGNYRDEASGKNTGNNILHLTEAGSPADAVRLEAARKKLFEVREKREHPLKDTKVLADWNGLMIAALAKAGRTFEEERYVRAAEKAAHFVAQEMSTETGTLWHRWREDHTAVPGQLEDYAFMIHGLIELYETTFDVGLLERALAYNDILSNSFRDESGGGYFMTADDAEQLIVRPKELYDGAIPSGNSVQMLNLLKLARLTGRSELEGLAAETSKAFGGSIERSPSSFSQALIALQFAEADSMEIVIVGEPDDATTQAMIHHIHSVYRPSKVLLLKTEANAERLAKLAPFTQEQHALDGKPTVYICRNFACERPINTLDELKEKLKQVRPTNARREGL